MKKKGNCDQCKEIRLLDDNFESTFHRFFKYRNLQIIIRGRFIDAKVVPEKELFLCSRCQLAAMRAIKNGDNWE